MPKHRDTLRIATWNCFGAPQSFEDFLSGTPFWPERLEAPPVVETLSKYDVVCVQENLVERVRLSLERIRDAAGFPHLWFDPMGPSAEDKTFVGGGLAILSRYPIHVEFVKLAKGTGPDGFARKGFAIGNVELPSGRRVCVVNTHLQADDPNVPLAACREARALQLRSLCNALAALSERKLPVVLCGDLNVIHGTAEYTYLERDLGDELMDLAADAGILASYDIQRNDVAAEFHTGGPGSMLLDYVWASMKHFEPEAVSTILDAPLEDVDNCPEGYEARAFSSDHFGIGATLSLR